MAAKRESNQDTLKNRVHNKKLIRKNQIINLLRIRGAMSRFDLSKATGYSPPIITQIIAELLTEGTVNEKGKGTSIGGRRPIIIDLIPESGYIVGIDIGKSQTVAVLMNLSTKIIAEIQEPSPMDETPSEISIRIKRMLNTLTAHTPRAQKLLKGIGIAIPGLIEKNRKVTFSDPKPYELVVEELKKELRLPIFVENDARLMGLGEKWFGLGHTYSNFIIVNLGYGIGVGIIINNQIYSGAFNHAGEFGHIRVEHPGKPCFCGGTGCLETVAGGWAIGLLGQKLAKKEKNSILNKISNGNIRSIDAKLVAEAARKGCEGSKQIFQKMAEETGRGIASIINLLNPELVILGGRMAYSSDIFFTTLNKSILSNVLPALKNEFKLEISLLKEKSSPLGACAMVLQEVFQSSYEEVLQLV